MSDEITRPVMLICVRPGELGIVIRRRAGIQSSLGGLSEDVVNDLSKLCRRRWNVHSRCEAAWVANSRDCWPTPLLPGFAFAKWNWSFIFPDGAPWELEEWLCRDRRASDIGR